MGKLLKKYLLAALLATVSVAIVYAANTKLTNVEVTGSLTVDGASTHIGAVTNTGAQTNTASVTNSGTTSLSSTTYTGGAVLWSRTIAQIQALQATTTGQMVLCQDCTQSAICVSSGSTAVNQWVVATSTGVKLGATFSGFPHCQ